MERHDREARTPQIWSQRRRSHQSERAVGVGSAEGNTAPWIWWFMLSPDLDGHVPLDFISASGAPDPGQPAGLGAMQILLFCQSFKAACLWESGRVQGFEQGLIGEVLQG